MRRKKTIKALNLEKVIENAEDVATARHVLFSFLTMIKNSDNRITFSKDPFNDDLLNDLTAMVYEVLRAKTDPATM